MIRLINGNCLEKLKELEDNSIDSVVTDPPYGLKFMSKKWDYDVPSIEVWQEILRVLKPGGHLLSFSGTRTYHRLVTNIEDAGFEIRDMVQWVYGSGFPKSENISKRIDKKLGAERKVIGTKKTNTSIQGNNYNSAEKKDKLGGVVNVTVSTTDEAKQWEGWGTALKPSMEPICLARKSNSEPTIAENVLRWSTGAINIDASRVPYVSQSDRAESQNKQTIKDIGGFASKDKIEQGKHIGIYGKGRGVPYIKPEGRWPANFIHDGSEEIMRNFPITKSGATKKNIDAYEGDSHTGFIRGVSNPSNQHGDSGSAARFFYCIKADRKERGVGNNHPTVKPIKLMEYLIKLITPPGGTVLDPFMGSGSTGIAAKKLGFNFVGIELEQEYYEIALKRLSETIQKNLF